MANRAQALLTGATTLALALSAPACGSPCPERVPSPSRSRQSRLVVLVMENKEYGYVIGDRGAPYTNALAHRYALAARYFAIAHPSLPNYLALIGGSTFGIHSDCTSCAVKATNLVDQLEQARVSWKAYMEDMPAPCYRGGLAGGYAKKHDPFLNFEDIARKRSRCSKVVPYSRLAGDMRQHRLPRFIWITPNLCHDTHDCDLRAGDSFLARLVPGLLRQLGPGGALFLLWDEGTSGRGCCRLAAGGRTPAIVAGPDVRRGLRSRARFDHYSALHTIEDAFGLGHLRGAACRCSRSLRSLFRRPPRLAAHAARADHTGSAGSSPRRSSSSSTRGRAASVRRHEPGAP